MAGKYAHIISKLPKLLPADASYQAKVEEVKKLILADKGVDVVGASELVGDYMTVRNELDELEKQTKNANLRLEALSQMLVQRFDDEDVTSMTITGGNVRVQYEPYAQVKDKERFRQWCVNTCQLCGLHKGLHARGDRPMPDERVVKASEVLNLHPTHPATTLEAQLQLWPSTMNSITKERLLKGYPEPEGVEAFQKPKIVLTRDKE